MNCSQALCSAQNCFLYYEPSCAEWVSQCWLCACGYETDRSGACVKRPQSDPAFCTDCKPNGACGSCKAGYKPDGSLCIPAYAGRRRLMSNSVGSEDAGDSSPLGVSTPAWSGAADTGQQVPVRYLGGPAHAFCVGRPHADHTHEPDGGHLHYMQIQPRPEQALLQCSAS